MLEISLVGETRIDSIGRRLRVATERKMAQLTGMLYDKVVENVSGKILQKQTGDLAGSIRQNLDLSGELMIGSVYPEPASPKAWALEKGGERYYEIVPNKASVLAFFNKGGEKMFASRVHHPPSKEFGYMANALAEMQELVPSGFREYIQAVLDGSDFG